MTSNSNILVPLDGSLLAEEAIRVAVDLAKPAGGTITLFVAAEPAAAEALHSYADSAEMTRATAADSYLEQVAARVRAEGVDAVTTSSDGTNVALDILERAAADDISMIVLTSHGRSGIGHWLLGSTADKVARLATVPVVIVPNAGRNS